LVGSATIPYDLSLGKNYNIIKVIPVMCIHIRHNTPINGISTMNEFLEGYFTVYGLYLVMMSSEAGAWRAGARAKKKKKVWEWGRSALAIVEWMDHGLMNG
jgi:hypothetical protein